MLPIRAFIVRFVPVVVVSAVMSAGCGSIPITDPSFNQRPSVELTQAPTGADSSRYSYAYRIFWSGYDPDGQVDHFEYAIDPPSDAQAAAGRETIWVRTLKHDELVRFSATRPDSLLDAIRPEATDFHTFVIRAVDNSGSGSRYSESKSRSFYAYTVAPEVRIVSPRPNRLLSPQVGSSVTITWSGLDPDGVGTQRPVQYKYLHLASNDTRYQLVQLRPDSLWRAAVSTGFADWDSVSAETTSVRITGLTPGSAHLFVVVAKDEAGAFTASLSRDANVLTYTVGTPSSSGPQIFVGVMGDGFNNFTYQGPFVGDELSRALQVPAGTSIRIAFYATPTTGHTIAGYRWALNIEDPSDETPRSSESDDLAHWSRWSPFASPLELGPFEGGSIQALYIEATDDDGRRSLAMLRLSVFSTAFDDPSIARDLLVVDDTRLEVDKFGSNGCPNQYTREWPSAAELDTFLYARGGKPWRCTRTPTTGVFTEPGILAGYAFDTLGTRRGYESPSDAVRLSTLAHYRHVLWLTDASGALNTDPTSATAPITALRHMSSPGRLNTLTAYMALGGKVWLAGGAGASMSLISFDKTGNNGAYGAAFDHADGELIAGRMMYDLPHWRSQLVSGSAATRVLKSPRAIGGWSHTAFGGGTVFAPDYAALPEELRQKSAVLGDLPPPTRSVSQQSRFYTYNTREVEYLSLPNRVIEDVDVDPAAIRVASVLDTLMMLEGGGLKNAFDTRTGSPLYQNATMTYYHGLQTPPVVFSGFNIWSYSRTDCIRMVDFVLQRIWGLPRQNVPR